ncbi:hypothetical protein OPS25_13770 [Alteromonas ponticola]|uniref:Uncharacterized protein n=1 Tax=Alteromonas aquimaris TaxID=2998417 RepID=A0ABT3P9W0_9ALTE|nr:hypothetical protein [Alteromonas aquimaris]MCW8109572.1 hypothetical protein [Alteromonas aquimaris]
MNPSDKRFYLETKGYTIIDSPAGSWAQRDHNQWHAQILSQTNNWQKWQLLLNPRPCFGVTPGVARLFADSLCEFERKGCEFMGLNARCVSARIWYAAVSKYPHPTLCLGKGEEDFSVLFEAIA